jgi:hypothetical protein
VKSVARRTQAPSSGSYWDNERLDRGTLVAVARRNGLVGRSLKIEPRRFGFHGPRLDSVFIVCSHINPVKSSR